jgi:hypothetical protein
MTAAVLVWTSANMSAHLVKTCSAVADLNTVKQAAKLNTLDASLFITLMKIFQLHRLCNIKWKDCCDS